MLYRVALSISVVSFSESWLGRTSIEMGAQEDIPLACAPGYIEDPTDFCSSFFMRKKGQTRYFHTETQQGNLQIPFPMKNK